MDSKKNVQIFLNTQEERNKVLKSTSSHERYIIHQNNTLHNENRSLMKEMEEITKEKNDLEDEVDKYDTSKRYTRGLLKNLSELEKLYNKVKEGYKSVKISRTRAENKFLRHIIRQVWMFQSVLVASAFAIWQFSIVDLLSMCLVFTIVVASSTSYKLFIRDIRKVLDNPAGKAIMEEIKKDEAEINKIKKSQDYLDDYIDSL